MRSRLQAKTEVGNWGQGAVEKLADKWLKKNESDLQWILNEGGPIAVVGPIEDGDKTGEEKADDEIIVPEIKDLDEVGDNMIMAIAMDEYENPFSGKHPEDSAFWKKIVKSVLSDEQQKSLTSSSKSETQKKGRWC